MRKPGGLLAGVQSVLQGQQQKSEEPQTGSEQEQSEPLFSAEASSVDRRSRPIEERLADIPDEINPEPSIKAEGKVEEGVSAGDIKALGEQVQELINEEDVKAIVAETFDLLASHFGSEHWRLGPRQVRMLGAPLTALLQHVWQKLAQTLPDVLAKWCEETPGAAMLVLSCGLVVVPRVVAQGSLNRKRGRSLWSVAPYRRFQSESVTEQKRDEQNNADSHDPFKHVPTWTGEKES
jgi:hypothetical protein